MEVTLETRLTPTIFSDEKEYTAITNNDDTTIGVKYRGVDTMETIYHIRPSYNNDKVITDPIIMRSTKGYYAVMAIITMLGKLELRYVPTDIIGNIDTNRPRVTEVVETTKLDVNDITNIVLTDNMLNGIYIHLTCECPDVCETINYVGRRV